MECCKSLCQHPGCPIYRVRRGSRSGSTVVERQQAAFENKTRASAHHPGVHSFCHVAEAVDKLLVSLLYPTSAARVAQDAPDVDAEFRPPVEPTAPLFPSTFALFSSPFTESSNNENDHSCFPSSSLTQTVRSDTRPLIEAKVTEAQARSQQC